MVPAGRGGTGDHRRALKLCGCTGNGTRQCWCLHFSADRTGTDAGNCVPPDCRAVTDGKIPAGSQTQCRFVGALSGISGLCFRCAPGTAGVTKSAGTKKYPRLLLRFKRRGFSFISCHLYPLKRKSVLEGFVVLGQHSFNSLHGLHSNTPFKNPVSSDRSVPKGFVVLGEQLFDSLHGFHSHAPFCFNKMKDQCLKVS